MLQPRFAMPFAHFIFDGRHGPDIDLDRPGRRDADLFSDYWQDFTPAGFEPDILSAWRNQMNRLRQRATAEVIMLHPMQGLRF
jgi:hypothetical protein